MADRTFAAYYESLSSESQWRSGEREQIGMFIGYTIANEIGIPHNPKGKTLILSTASNLGLMERGIQSEAGEGYSVIASDFASVERVGGALPLQADARELPIADNSIPCLVDIKGAFWHQLADYEFHPEAEMARKILQEYRSKLMDDGVLLVDDGYKYSTGEFIDQVFGSDALPGFETPQYIGEEPYILRVYRKIALTD